MKSTKIPENLIKLFWDIRLDSLDTELNRNLIMERVLNYGTLNDWRWLKVCYGLKAIQEFLNQTENTRQEGNVRQESRHLASLLLK